MIKEQWKQIDGFPKYQISNHGRIKSPRSKDFLNPQTTKTGYKRVILYNEDGPKQSTVHKLVLEHFVCKRPKGKVCAHNDGNPVNNLVTNLRWATPKENSVDMVKHGRSKVGEKHHSTRLTWENVKEIRSSFVPRKYSGKNCRYFASKFGCSMRTIQDVVNNKTWKTEVLAELGIEAKS